MIRVFSEGLQVEDLAQCLAHRTACYVLISFLPPEVWAGPVISLTSELCQRGMELTALTPIRSETLSSLDRQPGDCCCVFQVKVHNIISSLDSAQDFIANHISSVIIQVSFLSRHANANK